MPYDPTWESVSTHPLPDWYDDAKLGVFLHWGLYSVPGWAPQVGNIQELLKTEGPVGMLRDNPYAEWYRNTMQIEGSPTQVHHEQTYGKDFPYDGFIPAFNAGANAADLDSIADLAKSAGAKYVVLTTKHHEGFTLWPSQVENPSQKGLHAKRDIVGDLTEAVVNVIADKMANKVAQKITDTIYPAKVLVVRDGVATLNRGEGTDKIGRAHV